MNTEIKLSNIYGFSEIGKKENQEDFVWPQVSDNPTFNRTMVLCDGMGGHEKGEIASKCVAEYIGTAISKVESVSITESKNRFTAIYQRACDYLNSFGDDSDNPKSMGTTLTCLLKCTNGILASHIGDSRIYQIRKGKGIIFRSRDHSVVAELIATGEISEDEARNSPIRNQLTKAIQAGKDNPNQPTYDEITDIRCGDIFILCSDGVMEQVSDQELTEIFSTNMALYDGMKELQTRCSTRNTKDNYSCMGVEVINRTLLKKQSLIDKILNVLKL